jgi:hypothetical protein
MGKSTREELDHITAAIIFYLSHLFKLKFVKDRDFVRNVLWFLDSNNITTYINYHNIFFSEKE